MKTKPNPRETMESFGTLYCNEDVLKTMPQGEGPVEFFTLGRYVSDDELEKEYASRGLVPASPYALAEAHIANPALVEEKRCTATHWKDTSGKWCFAAFRRWDGERRVDVYRGGDDWRVRWSFAGVRKSSALEPQALPSDPLPLVLEINGHTYKRV